MSRFYITTPIYYVNALPHLGTFYTTVVADAFARYQRARANSRGDDPKASVFFLTGLDEHGQKIERIARDLGMDPQAYCDGIAAKFQETWKQIGISNDDFIRTTSPRHKAAATEMWGRLAAKKGPDGRPDLFEAEYDGMYCVGCEEAKSEDDVVADGDRKLCKIHLTPVEKVKEKNYFFRLSAYTDRLLAWYEQSPVRPESRLNEVRSFVKGGLRDLSISRSTVKWGIPVPGDPKQTMYVWIDALTNYLTVLGGPDAVARGEGKAAFWSGANHLIAKDILRFHAVYWPALLMSAGLPPPKQIFCHGYLTVKGQKISKSMPATRVDPTAIAAELGVDPLRYFVLREYTFGGDGDFTYEALFQRYQADLGNDLGNLLNRTLSMVHRYLGSSVAPAEPTEPEDAAPATIESTSTGSSMRRLDVGGATEKMAERVESLLLDKVAPAVLDKTREKFQSTMHLRATATPTNERAAQAWEEFDPSGALELTWSLVRQANRHIDLAKPWELAKTNSPQTRRVLLDCLEALRWAALMVAPAMPSAAKEILRQLGREQDEGTWPGDFRWPGGTLAEPNPVFPRIDPDRQAALITKWVPAEATPAARASMASGERPAASASMVAGSPARLPADISIDDFAKIELRAAKVLTAERVPKADKLLKLTLDIGTGEPRTVVSGIAPTYTPEAIVGRTVIYFANLAPRKIRGVVSQGMILAAGDADVLGLSALDRDVPPGTRVR